MTLVVDPDGAGMTGHTGHAGEARTTQVPAVVEEAEAELRTYRRWLGLAGGGWSALWLAGNLSVLYLPISLLVVPLVGIGLALIRPPGRKLHRAREVLRRWDTIHVDRAFDAAGAPSAPRLVAAEAMAARIREAHSGDERVHGVVTAVVESVRRSEDDLRTIDLVRRTRPGAGAASQHVRPSGAPPNPVHERTHHGDADPAAHVIRDQVEMRIAHLLTTLQAMHEAVVARDDDALHAILDEADGLIGRFAAEHEVEAMLNGGD